MNMMLTPLAGNDESRRRRDGKWNAFFAAANDAVFEMRRMG